MKYCIASDIHGSCKYASIICERFKAEKADKLLILGDILYHGPRNDLPDGYAPKKVIELLNSIKNDIIAVRGNCEAEVDSMVLDFPCMSDYAVVMTETGRCMYLTHGHIYNPENLPPLADGSIFLYGHTHVKVLDKSNNIYIMNPGSVSIPKDGKASYGIYENGKLYLKDLDGNIISEKDVI